MKNRVPHPLIPRTRRGKTGAGANFLRVADADGNFPVEPPHSTTVTDAPKYGSFRWVERKLVILLRHQWDSLRGEGWEMEYADGRLL